MTAKAFALLLYMLSYPVLADAPIQGQINQNSIQTAVLALLITPDHSDVHIIIDSEGGEVDAGMDLVNEIRYAQKRGVKVTCVVVKEASSMAAYLLQACDLRAARMGSMIMFHAPSADVYGNKWKMARVIRLLEKIEENLSSLVVSRLHLTQEEFSALIEDRDWYLTPQEALDVGAIDLVVP